MVHFELTGGDLLPDRVSDGHSAYKAAFTLRAEDQSPAVVDPHLDLGHLFPNGRRPEDALLSTPSCTGIS